MSWFEGTSCYSVAFQNKNYFLRLFNLGLPNKIVNRSFNFSILADVKFLLLVVYMYRYLAVFYCFLMIQWR